MADHIMTLLIAIFASTGFWSLVTAAFQNSAKRKSEAASEDRAERALLLGLAHDRLYALCYHYLERGEITAEEYDNLLYIYRPYHEAGGNGTGDRLMAEIESLPIK